LQEEIHKDTKATSASAAAAQGGPKKKKKRKVVKKERESSPTEIPIDPNEPTYCLCNQVSYGEMIGCDNMECKIEWYHFNCVQLTHKPKGKWYCPNCRGDRPNVMRRT
jgi:inhibitor-of-growth protein 1